MSRIPIRIRVTLAFTLVMAALLAALGLFIYDRVESQLNDTIDQGLRGRIEIPYYTAEDFERIFELLAGTPASDVVS